MDYRKIEGERLKLGYDVGKTTIKEILRRHGIPPGPDCCVGRFLSGEKFPHHTRVHSASVDYRETLLLWQFMALPGLATFAAAPTRESSELDRGFG